MIKNSFILYIDYFEQISLLSDEQAGMLIKALYHFQVTGEAPEIPDGMVRMAFSFISTDMKRDSKKYEEICERKSEAGKKGGRPRKDAQISCSENASASKAESPADSEKSQPLQESPTQAGDIAAEADNTAPSAQQKHFGRYGNVVLTEPQYDRLIREYGKTVVGDYINRLGEYSYSHGKSYPDCNSTIRKWLDKDHVPKSDVSQYTCVINRFPETFS